jgi:hypothetical protein
LALRSVPYGQRSVKLVESEQGPVIVGCWRVPVLPWSYCRRFACELARKGVSNICGSLPSKAHLSAIYLRATIWRRTAMLRQRRNCRPPSISCVFRTPRPITIGQLLAGASCNDGYRRGNGQPRLSNAQNTASHALDVVKKASPQHRTLADARFSGGQDDDSRRPAWRADGSKCT